MKRPNILILYTDQQRWDAVGCNGNSEILTPNQNRLAAEGINFDHYFIQNPVCMPSRVSFLTGQYCSTLGITHMGVPVPKDTITLPRLLRNYGYTSANIGKLHFLPHACRDHREIHPDYGFDHMEISDEPGCYEDAYRAWVRRRKPQELDAVSLGLPPATENWQRAVNFKDGINHPKERFPKHAMAFRGSSDVTHTAFVAEQTLEFIGNHAEGPFLCIAGFYSPHSPWVAPQEFLDLYNPATLTLPQFPPEVDAQRGPDRFSDQELRSAKHGYYAMISEVDHYVGRILDRLDALGIADNTIIIYTSDHGEWLGEHLKYGKGYPGNDCISRVPFLLRWPEGTAAPGQAVSAIIEGVDCIPTLLECAGIPVPQHLQGQSLLPLIDNPAHKGKNLALMEMNGWRSVRTERFRYILRSSGEEVLYDLQQDPGEYHNCAADQTYAETIASHRKLLLHRLIESERPIPNVWSY